MLHQAKTLDQYRSLLERNDPQDSAVMAELMSSLGLTSTDVETDFEAIQRHNHAQSLMLDEAGHAKVRDDLNREMAAITDETGNALAKLWSMVPVEFHAAAFREILGFVLFSIPDAKKPLAIQIARWQEWDVRTRQAKHLHQQAIASDRSARAEAIGLKSSHPRVLSESVTEVADAVAA